MNLSRRTFLKGVVTVTAAVTVAQYLPSIPTLWADGIHDDSPGLDALFSGEPVDLANDAVRILQGEQTWLCGGAFRISRPMNLGGFNTLIEGCKLIVPENVCIIGDAAHSSKCATIIRNCIITSDGYEAKWPGDRPLVYDGHLVQVYGPTKARALKLSQLSSA